MYLELDVNVLWESVELNGSIGPNLGSVVFPVIDKNAPGGNENCDDYFF